MKISEETIEILKNFALINQSIWVNQHEKKIKTISIAKNILATAEVQEDFPVDFGIYSLSEFLNVLSLFDEPDIDFKDKYMMIKEKGKGSKVRYYYASSDVIIKPEKDISLSDPDVSVDLKKDDLAKVMKASGVLVLPDISVVGSGGVVKLVAHQQENPSSNSYEITVEAEVDDSAEFNMDFLAENLKMIPMDYHVDLYAKGISHFKSGDKKLQYWVALQPSSNYSE